MKNIITIDICGHKWDIRFLPKDLLKKEVGFDVLGFTFVDRFSIDVVDSCTKQETKRILSHELTHAIICSQGRAFQKKFSQEEVCEYVAWTFEMTNRLVKEVMKKRYGED